VGTLHDDALPQGQRGQSGRLKIRPKGGSGDESRLAMVAQRLAMLASAKWGAFGLASPLALPRMP
jgi:hypothetical protein